MSSELAQAPVNPGFHKATSALSATLGIEPRMMVDTLKKQCFPSMRPEDISDAQLAAFISVANAMELNPLIPGQLYAYPGKNGGIIPVTGPDGVLKKLDEGITEGKLDGYECTVYPEDVTLPPTHAIAKIFRTGKDAHPSMFTAIFKEWVVSSNGNWGSRPRHMLWLRAIKQCARQVIHGVPFDEDDIKIGDMVNVTPETPIDRPPPKERSKKGVAAVVENPKPAEKPAAAGNVVEGDFTEVAKTEEKKPFTPSLSDPAQPTGDGKLDFPAASVSAAPATSAANAPRTSLKDGEKMEATVKIVEASALFVTVGGERKATIRAKVSGGYDGVVDMHGGAQVKGDDAVVAAPWVVGNTVAISLFGKLSPKMGVVKTLVAAIKPVAEEESGD